MLIGILGDIHGNIDALEAMLRQLDSLHVSQLLCTGDIVGYGAAPAACIDRLRERQIACVMGNHDCYTAFPERLTSGVREEAVEVFSWNRSVLSQEHLDWLGALPRVLQFETFEVRHDSCAPFPPWDYVLNARTAMQHFLYQTRPLCFNGHSHVPLLAAHAPGAPIRLQRLQNMMLPRRMDVMVGVGAVGQPRDGDPRACAIVYNTADGLVRIQRVNYDIGRAQKRILDAGLPHSLAFRLAAGR